MVFLWFSYGFPMVFPLKYPSWCLEDHGDLGMTHPTEALWSETAATILAAGRAPFVFFGTGWNLWKTIGKWRFSWENNRKTIGKPSKIWRVSTINPWRFQLELVGFVTIKTKKVVSLFLPTRIGNLMRICYTIEGISWWFTRFTR